MHGLLQGKVCIITGSTRGIGKETALLFAREGADVIVNGAHPGAADEWIAACPEKDRLHAYYFDITKPDEIKQNIKAIRKAFGRIDVLVNNAGVEYNELIGLLSREHMEEMFRVNVYGMIEMIQACARVIGKNEHGGSIINITSMVGLRGNTGQLVYSATKGAVAALTKSASKELARLNVRVNAIAPGLTQTEMADRTDPEKIKARIERVSLGRIAQPRDIAGGCLLLASDYASYITGQILPVDGGTAL